MQTESQLGRNPVPNNSSEESADLTLPYHFDTTGPICVILRAVLLLCAALALGIAYLLLARQDSAGAAGLLIAASMAAWFGGICFHHLAGGVGTISSGGIVLRPGKCFGISFKGPKGEFKLSQFSAVRVDIVNFTDVSGPIFGRIFLRGRAGTPDIQISSLPRDQAKLLGAKLSSVLNLQFLERGVPY